MFQKPNAESRFTSYFSFFFFPLLLQEDIALSLCETDTVCSEVLSFEVPGLSWDLCPRRASARRDD